jgi:hypothetical protein
MDSNMASVAVTGVDIRQGGFSYTKDQVVAEFDRPDQERRKQLAGQSNATWPSLIDQLKEIYFEGELEPVDTVQWYLKVMRKDYTVGLSPTANGLDDPTRLCTKISPVGPRATMTATAIHSSIKWSIGSRWNLTR